MRKVNQYTRQIKLDAVKLVTEQKMSVKSVSETMGINIHVVYRWLREWEKYGEEAYCGIGRLLTVQAKLNKSTRRIAELEEENAMLKKYTAYLVKKRGEK